MSITLTHVTFDCADAAALAGFWAAALERTVDDGASADFATIPGSPGWMFSQVPEAKSAKNRMHVDVSSPDVEVEVQRL